MNRIKQNVCLVGEKMQERKGKERGRWRAYIGGAAAVGGAVRFDEPAGLGGEMAEDLVDVGAGGETVAAVLAEAVEDFGCDGPPLPLPHLCLLFLALAPPMCSRHFLHSLMLSLSLSLSQIPINC